MAVRYLYYKVTNNEAIKIGIVKNSTVIIDTESLPNNGELGLFKDDNRNIIISTNKCKLKPLGKVVLIGNEVNSS
ncbi:hypothetical protein [Spartinivicinus ruber]|uniref:hypothetical protein n=1 Tax=Spartinivicinus ruber TaxID=2683272 RepID=UPI0013D70C93|nr:hypothetical protein [Spartinivicinus ruber]